MFSRIEVEYLKMREEHRVRSLPGWKDDKITGHKFSKKLQKMIFYHNGDERSKTLMSVDKAELLIEEGCNQLLYEVMADQIRQDYRFVPFPVYELAKVKENVRECERNRDFGSLERLVRHYGEVTALELGDYSPSLDLLDTLQSYVTRTTLTPEHNLFIPYSIDLNDQVAVDRLEKKIGKLRNALRNLDVGDNMEDQIVEKINSARLQKQMIVKESPRLKLLPEFYVVRIPSIQIYGRVPEGTLVSYVKSSNGP